MSILKEIISFASKRYASDIHIASDMNIFIRIDGKLYERQEYNTTHQQVEGFLNEIMDEHEKTIFQNERSIDLSFSPSSKSICRVNAFFCNKGLGLSIRLIPTAIPSLEEIHVPESIKDLLQLKSGLILVTGATGSGKSTTLAAMLQHINNYSQKHIITIEDPIEYIYQSGKSLINQRQIGAHSKSFNMALKNALRQDPDVILIGELRDAETIQMALTAAETGHLVFATLHTNSAAKSISRIIDVFPEGDKHYVSALLSSSLRAVIAQQLIRRIQGGRIAAFEILRVNDAVRNLIKDNKVQQIQSAIEIGAAEGMITMQQALQQLKDKGFIDNA